jgi:hypothetical protein
MSHLLASLCEDLRPQGALQEILVEKIAMSYWRLHLGVGYETDFAGFKEVFLESSDRLCRYTTSVHRQLTQDMNQLERLQRQRNGEFVSAALSVDVAISGLDIYGQVDGMHEIEVSQEIIVDLSGDADIRGRVTSEISTVTSTQINGTEGPLQADEFTAAKSSLPEATLHREEPHKSGEDPWTTGHGCVEKESQELLLNETTVLTRNVDAGFFNPTLSKTLSHPD